MKAVSGQLPPSTDEGWSYEIKWDGMRLLGRCADGEVTFKTTNGLDATARFPELGGIAEAVEIAEPSYMLERISHTFHGRDIFSPAAAHLASGVELGMLGPALDPAALRRLEVPEPAVGEARIRATVLYIDRYGNVQLNLTAEHLARVGIEPGSRVEVEVGFERYFASAVRTFADARMGDIVVYEDAYANIALAINRGNAAQMFSVRVGDELRLTAA